MEKKMTKKEMFERVIKIVEGANVEDKDILVEKLENEIALLAKKRTGQTKTQKENEKLVEKVFDVIAEDETEEGITIAEVFNKMQDVEGITSTNKVSALIKKLKDAGRVTRVDNGRNKNVTFKVNTEVE